MSTTLSIPSAPNTRQSHETPSQKYLAFSLLIFKLPNHSVELTPGQYFYHIPVINLPQGNGGLLLLGSLLKCASL